MKSELFGEDLAKLWPLIAEGQSDTACFDNALELLFLGGYSLAHAMMLLIPEASSGCTCDLAIQTSMAFAPVGQLEPGEE